MGNNKGFGMLGLLVAVLLVGILMTVVLKQYTARMAGASSAFSELQKLQPVQKGGLDKKMAPGVGAQKEAENAPLGNAGKGEVGTRSSSCEGKWVGNICVPTQMRTSQDDFEQMYK